MGEIPGVGIWRRISLAAETQLKVNTSATKRHWPILLFLGALYLVGIVGFGIFYHWSKFDLNYMDWSLITGPRLQFLKVALQEGVLPLHISSSATLHSETTRYLSVADISISPQYILLLWLSIAQFNLINTWILYTFGFAGLLVLGRKLKLSAISFTFMFLLFNFNGSILAHFSVGHESFSGYFLFPWFVWLVIRLLEGDHSWLWTTAMSVLLFAIWLQGGYHQVTWMLIMLTAIAIFVPRTLVTVVKTGAITLVVSAFRLLPCILSYSVYKQNFLNGFPSLYALWNNLVDLPGSLISPFFSNSALGRTLGEWELTYFIGLPAVLVLLYFGIYRGLIRPDARYQKLMIPLGILFLLSMGPTFGVLRMLPIPLIQGERVSTRIFSLVLAFLVVLGAERLQRWLDAYPQPQKAMINMGWTIGLLVVAVELWQDLSIWKLTNRLPDYRLNFFPADWYPVNNYNDTIYIALVVGGFIISILSILVLAWLSWRERRVSGKMDGRVAAPA